MLCLPEGEEITMPDFDVGNPILQDLLEWVDQPPPQQGRDTHALTAALAHLQPIDERGFGVYRGLLFFRPGNPTSSIFEQQPGLSGTLLPTGTHYQTPDETAEEFRQTFFVRINLRFKPPSVFAALLFLRMDFPGLPGETVREVKFSQVELSERNWQQGGGLRIEMDPPSGWGMWEIGKTTVLYRQP